MSRHAATASARVRSFAVRRGMERLGSLLHNVNSTVYSTYINHNSFTSLLLEVVFLKLLICFSKMGKLNVTKDTEASSLTALMIPLLDETNTEDIILQHYTRIKKTKNKNLCGAEERNVFAKLFISTAWFSSC